MSKNSQQARMPKKKKNIKENQWKRRDYTLLSTASYRPKGDALTMHGMAIGQHLFCVLLLFALMFLVCIVSC